MKEFITQHGSHDGKGLSSGHCLKGHPEWGEQSAGGRQTTVPGPQNHMRADTLSDRWVLGREGLQIGNNHYDSALLQNLLCAVLVSTVAVHCLKGNFFYIDKLFDESGAGFSIIPLDRTL